MSLRTLLAPALATINALVRGFVPVPSGAVRILVLHDIPANAHSALARLVDHIAAGPGFITPADAADRLSGAIADDRAPVLLSFDDGFVSNLVAAREVLEPRGIRALFFVCPGLVDLSPAQRPAAIARHIFRGQLPAEALSVGLDLIGWADLAALAEAGHEIGCHGFSHDRLSGLDSASLEHQVGLAKVRLAEVLGRQTNWFAFPFGDITSIDPAALSAIATHFRFCRSGIRGLAHAGSHPLALPAESVDLGASWSWQRLTIEGGLAPLYHRPLASLTTWARTA